MTWAELEQKRQSLLAGVWNETSGAEWCGRWTDAVDRLVRGVFDQAQGTISGEPLATLVATGGYGRKELAPYSDIDLALVPREEGHPDLDRLTRLVFRELQDGFHKIGLKVGYSFRLLSDMPGLDSKSRTGLIDARWIAGDNASLRRVQAELWTDVPLGAFLLSKIGERTAAEQKSHSTPYVVEPHLKEGRGGLRCFQTTNWLRAAIGERLLVPSEAYDRILHLRNQLHVVSGGLNDRLTRGRQAEIFERSNRDIFEALGKLWVDLGDVSTHYDETVERLRNSRFRLTPRTWNYGGDLRSESTAAISEVAMAVTYAIPLGLTVSPFPVSVDPRVEYGEVALCLRAGSQAIRTLDRARLLDDLLPELGACRAVAPRDSSHSYSVFEHSLRAFEQCERLVRESPVWAEMISEIRDPALLFLAILLHDIGKVTGESGHAASGAILTEEIAKRWRMDARDRQTLVWLVAEHLEMARFARMRDVFLPETAQEFAKFVGTDERLKLLTLLTVADIAAVSPDSLTPVLENFLVELYERTSHELKSESPSTVDLAAYRRRMIRRAEPHQGAAIEAFLESLPAHYTAAMPVETAEHHLDLFERAKEEGVAVEFAHLEQHATEITLCVGDRTGLLSQILGTFYALDLSLIALRAHTTSTEPPYAIDVFTVTFGDRPLPSGTAAKTIQALKSVLSGEASVDDLLQSTGKDPTREQEIYKWVFVAGSPAILEIRAPRGRGMAYRMSRKIARFGWNVQSARVGIWAGQGAAAFYVTGAAGATLAREDVEEKLGRQV